jgi:hypothetical protein
MRTLYDDDVDAFDEDGLLKDGHSVRVPLMLKDAMHDGFGGAPGRKPGFAFTRDSASRARVAAAYEDYEEAQQSAWRGPIHEVADEQTNLSVSDAAAHNDRTEPRPMDEVYRLYDEELSVQWKGPSR